MGRTIENDFEKEINDEVFTFIYKDFELDAIYNSEGEEVGKDFEIPSDIAEELEEDLDEAYFEKYGEARREETSYKYEREEYEPWNWGW